MPSPLDGLRTAFRAQHGKRVKMAGAGYHMQDAHAQHTAEEVTFRAYLKMKTGTVLADIQSKRITLRDAERFVERRIRRFKKFPGARESVEDAVLRKVIAAQGKRFVGQLRERLDDGAQMELDMMLSPDSHMQGTSSRAKSALHLYVKGDGRITGLPTPELADTEGITYGPS